MDRGSERKVASLPHLSLYCYKLSLHFCFPLGWCHHLYSPSPFCPCLCQSKGVGLCPLHTFQILHPPSGDINYQACVFSTSLKKVMTEPHHRIPNLEKYKIINPPAVVVCGIILLLSAVENRNPQWLSWKPFLCAVPGTGCYKPLFALPVCLPVMFTYIPLWHLEAEGSTQEGRNLNKHRRSPTGSTGFTVPCTLGVTFNFRYMFQLHVTLYEKHCRIYLQSRLWSCTCACW